MQNEAAKKDWEFFYRMRNAISKNLDNVEGLSDEDKTEILELIDAFRNSASYDKGDLAVFSLNVVEQGNAGDTSLVDLARKTFGNFIEQ